MPYGVNRNSSLFTKVRSPVPSWVVVRWKIASRKLHEEIFGPGVPMASSGKPGQDDTWLWSHVFSFFAANRIFRYYEIFDLAREYKSTRVNTLSSPWTPDLDHSIRVDFANFLETRARELNRWDNRDLLDKQDDPEARQRIKQLWAIEAVKCKMCPVCGDSDSSGYVPPCHGFGKATLDFYTDGVRILVP